MQEEIKISVIVPVYNTREYLEQCLDSIIDQSYKQFQLVLVDDGSSDGSELICDQYAKRDNRIKVIHQKNAGLVNARKVGAQEAEGNYVYYVDCDDWIDNNVLQSFVDILATDLVDMISVGVKREYGNARFSIDSVPFEDGLYVNREIRNKLIPKLISTDKFFDWGQHLTFWHFLFRKELLLKNQEKLDDQIVIGEDFGCIYPCILDANSIYIRSDIFYHYRQRSNSLKWMENPKEYENFQLVYKILLDRFSKEAEAASLVKKLRYLLVFELLTSVAGKVEFSDVLFPYEDFPQGSKVIVYGAGLFGNKIVTRLHKSRYADIVAWLDKNYKSYQEKGIFVEAPERIKQLEYDYVIMAVIRDDIRQNIRVELEEAGVPEAKIIDISLSKIDAVSLPKEFEDVR